jgi:cell division protein FtsN
MASRTTPRTTTAKRPTRVPPSRRQGAGGTLLGIFIGLLLGLGLAAGVAYYLMGGRSAYQPAVTTNKDVREPARDQPTKTAGTDKGADAAGERPRFDFYKILPGGDEPKIRAGDAGTTPDKKQPERPDKALVEKAAEKSASDKAASDKAAAQKQTGDKTAATKPVVPLSATGAAQQEAVASADAAGRKPRSDDRYWLQAGSFSQQADAENLKAQLALAGLQAAVQTGLLDDKSVRYRVRLGPYDNSDEMARVKTQLAQHGFEATAIRY